MAEWLKAAVLKTASRVIVTGVRIPLPPPCYACYPIPAALFVYPERGGKWGSFLALNPNELGG